jgi:hypothetical protein
MRGEQLLDFAAQGLFARARSRQKRLALPRRNVERFAKHCHLTVFAIHTKNPAILSAIQDRPRYCYNANAQIFAKKAALSTHFLRIESKR